MSRLSQPDLRGRFRDLIYAETGIRMPANKDHLLASRLQRRLLEGGFRDLDDYLAHLFSGGALNDEWKLIVDKVTTNKTDFFREPAHFDILARKVIPEALNRTRPGAACRFRLWSAASSTGAEAWSAAMVLADAALADARLDWAILGTDISSTVLEQATRAIYPSMQMAPVPPDMRSRYVMMGRGRSAGEDVRIVPELRRRARFAELNLIDPPFPVAHNLDAIFLRNVLIYFDAAQQARVVSDVVNHLRVGGWFFVGHAESMIVDDPRLKQHAPAAFRRQEVDA
ncbi:CheR family methyltransferase [Salipiger mucosus]|uniref:Chemotaxis protein methyltransferase n=1 Tax=Salipiger mucosus DSM 16094 TaxID=1123237 RepID=S9RKL0_9RHOB|nr:CheR family methyltransferase [Salipiger mucosus]EPX78650.1 Chemotaxis protein methyltransferase CheR [Salipiger mucosus DSM 16094]